MPIAIRLLIRNFVLLTLPSVLVLILLLELFCRFLLKTSDVPVTGFSSPIGNHYLANQSGRYIKGVNSNIDGIYRINGDGWNSPVEYAKEKENGVYRIAIIGDSYVEALQVNNDKSFPYILEAKLNELGSCKVEVFSYGHSGANLAQYLNVLRHRVLLARPDLVIFNVIHNDFQESLTGYSRQDNWSIGIDEDLIFEVPPRPLRSLPFKQAMSHSALIRYLIINLDMGARFAALSSFIRMRSQHFESNINTSIELLSDNRKLNTMLRYILRESEVLAKTHRFKLMLVIDTDRMAIYHGVNPRNSITYKFNEAMRLVAREEEIYFLDLTNAFMKSWETNQKYFNWTFDYHWNNLGHEVVANELNRFIDSEMSPNCNVEML